jgi:hypothetical protein
LRWGDQETDREIGKEIGKDIERETGKVTGRRTASEPNRDSQSCSNKIVDLPHSKRTKSSKRTNSSNRQAVLTDKQFKQTKREGSYGGERTGTNEF